MRMLGGRRWNLNFLVLLTGCGCIGGAGAINRAADEERVEYKLALKESLECGAKSKCCCVNEWR